ncbi:uncharacterized protein LOC129875690, partial [Solanum dulcamara]|uniref:uncharacterized protein LOC129875690 n=1 Tax=Solanum dulcamara TaxID=45834 RepID=UPI002486AEF2
NAFGERKKMCVISNRNESIMKSLSIVFPNIPHYACIWHLWKNVCMNFKRSKNTLSDLFYSMAKSYRKEDFEKLMAKVEKIDYRIKEYLEVARYEKWSRVDATINRERMMTSNIAECINGCLVEVQQLPILEFLEEARILFGSWHCNNREVFSYTKETLGKRFEEILILNASKSSRMKVCILASICYVSPVIPSSEFMNLEEDTLYTLNEKYICIHTVDYCKPDALAKTYEVPMVPMPDKED